MVLHNYEMNVEISLEIGINITRRLQIGLVDTYGFTEAP